ncbi:MAG: DeoR/GlpR family DNA-binding transcription regulator [Sphaerochaetaceae bacterium]
MTIHLKPGTRREKILEILRKEGSVKVHDLSEKLGYTAVTIRSDLAALEKERYLQRTSGGAIINPQSTYKTDFRDRLNHNLAQKEAIATETAKMIPAGSTVMLNSGTTTFLVCQELKKKSNLNIVTNSIEAALDLGSSPSLRVILLGGDINAQYGFLYGNDTIEQMVHYKADYAILAMDGVCNDGRLTTFHSEEALVDRIMIERSRKTIIVADSSKYQHEGFYFVSDLEPNSVWVTDTNIAQSAISEMKTIDIEIVTAS